MLLPISFTKELGKHNLMDLVLNKTEYTECQDKPFPDYIKRLPIYNDTIVADAFVGVQAKAKVKHNAKLNDWQIFLAHALSCMHSS
jgi:hypothetical protein